MLLKSFHVRLFRNIVDSGEIKVIGNTCLVGKNEAGKSACIEALHRLNPSKPVALDVLEDYPRWLKKQHEISGEITDAVPITATFELSDEEIQEIESRFGAGILSNRQVTASRKYGAEIEITPTISFPVFLEPFITRHAGTLRGQITAATTSELANELKRLAKVAGVEGSEEAQHAALAVQAKAALEKEFDGKGSLTSWLQGYLLPRIPKTFYFSVYAQLRGRYNLAEVLPAVANGSPDESLQTAADFLKLANVTASNVESVNFEQSNAELEAISSLLTQRVRANWKQNQHLRLLVKIEAVHVQQRMDRYLQFRVEDTRHDFTSRLDRRSTGFQWFVSFMAAFFEFEKEKNIILLLDEPGLSLHARAQMDLLESIDTNLTKGRQVIYTTHSPFMVRTEALDRVRIVEDKGPEQGAIVTNDAGKISDPDTLFPLQAALGYDIAQSLFIGNRNILVEGVSEFIYLTILSQHLRTSGGPTIPPDARLLPAGGATNIPTFIALLGTSLKIVVLLDGKAQRQKIDRAIADGRLAASRVLRVDQYCAVSGADIEDLFSVDEYLDLYNDTFGKTLTASALTGSDRIVKRIERLEGEFDHGYVAAHFLSNQQRFVAKLSRDTVKRFGDLIAALAKALPESSATSAGP